MLGAAVCDTSAVPDGTQRKEVTGAMAVEIQIAPRGRPKAVSEMKSCTTGFALDTFLAH